MKKDWLEIHHLILNESKINIINKQNQMIRKGSKVPYSMLQDMTNIIYDIVLKYNLNIEYKFGDKFTRTELIRFKYEFDKTLELNRIEPFIKEIQEEVQTLFNISYISYNEVDSKSLLIIWI